ncbi:MAG: LptE family protein [Bacteroidales bacterium]|nr:LptE family protein [Bacteroidales bacterium]
MKNLSRLLLVLALLVSSIGCKVSYTMTGASISADTKTISVAYFQNRAPIVYTPLSQELTEQLKDKFISQTSLNMVSDNGDLSFEGEITGYETRPVAITGGDQTEKASLNRLTVTIQVKFTNQKDPKSNFDTKFTAFEDYNSDKDLDEVEGELIPLILEKLIEDIFNKSVVNW